MRKKMVILIFIFMLFLSGCASMVPQPPAGKLNWERITASRDLLKLVTLGFYSTVDLYDKSILEVMDTATKEAVLINKSICYDTDYGTLRIGNNYFEITYSTICAIPKKVEKNVWVVYTEWTMKPKGGYYFLIQRFFFYKNLHS